MIILSTIFYVVLTYIIVSLFGYFAHKSLHFKWMRGLHTSHMAHHNIYPDGDFESEKYRSVGKDDTIFAFALLSLPVILTPILLGVFGFISLFHTIIIVIEMLLIGWLNNYFHEIFHVKNHWAYKIPLFNKLLKIWYNLHFHHHQSPHTNFGIFGFHWDRLFKTFKK